MSRILRPVLPLAAVLLISCGAGDVTTAGGEVPDSVSENFRQVSVSPEGRLEVESDRVEIYSKSDLTVFTDVRMREIDPEGEPVIEGSADRVEVTGDRDGTAAGNVRVSDLAGDARIEAERLVWADRNRILTGEGPVTIESGDGIVITGEGFIADLARDTYSFSGGADGTVELKNGR